MEKVTGWTIGGKVTWSSKEDFYTAYVKLGKAKVEIGHVIQPDGNGVWEAYIETTTGRRKLTGPLGIAGSFGTKIKAQHTLLVAVGAIPPKKRK